jgi:hypothetical protein
MTRFRSLFAGVSLIVASAALAPPRTVATAHASAKAAPGRIVFSGGMLSRRIVLDNWNENLRVMLAASEIRVIPQDSLRERPRINVAMYWGLSWQIPRDAGDSTPSLSDGQRAQPGTFYPTFHGRDALWVFGPNGLMRSSTRVLQRDGLDVLATHGIPVVAK